MLLSAICDYIHKTYLTNWDIKEDQANDIVKLFGMSNVPLSSGLKLVEVIME